MRIATKSGVALLILGFGILGLWSWWKRTRNFVPVDMPVSLAAGKSIASQFKLNFDGSYLIEIEADRSVPSSALRCLMGVTVETTECRELPPALQASWTLSRGSQEITRGSSGDLLRTSSESDQVTRVIGEFPGKAGQEYKLEMFSSADGSALSAANPHLKVIVASISYTDLQSAGVLVFSMAFICELFGIILLAIAFHASRKKSVREPGYRE